MTHNKKIIVTASLIFLVFIIIPISIFIATRIITKPVVFLDNSIIIDNVNDYRNNVNLDIFTNISTSAYNVALLNTKNPEKNYHGVIRSKTFKNTSNSSVSFILDIPSIKISLYSSQALDNIGQPLSDSLIKCVDKSQIIYQTTNSCIDKDINDLSDKQIEQLKIADILPLSGPTYNITSKISPDNSGYILIINYHSEPGKKDAIDAIKTLGYNPDIYEIQYIND